MFRLSFQGAGPGGDTGTINIVTAATPSEPYILWGLLGVKTEIQMISLNKFKTEFYWKSLGLT